MMLKKLFQAFSLDIKGVLLIVLGSLSWSMTMVKSGLIYPFGMGFWGPNGHDGIWHIALAQELSKGDWRMPVFAGEAINNYHIGFDLLLAAIHKISFIPFVNLYFQIIPPILAVALGLATYRFVFDWTKSKVAAFWSLFFLYFGGSFGWIFTIVTIGQLGGESLFWAQQGISTLINPPFALSLIFVFLGLTYLLNGLEKDNKKYLMLATFLFGTLVQIKVYAGILILTGLFISGFFDLFVNRKTQILKVFVGSLVLSILLFSSTAKTEGGIIIFKPFWFIESLLASPDRFYWPRFADALFNYRLGAIWYKAVPAYIVAIVVFLVGNFGTRILSLCWVGQRGVNIRKYGVYDVFILTVVFTGIIIPLFFVQSGTPWNTIQFLYYSLVFSGILAGIWIANFVGSTKLNTTILYSIVVLLIILTAPTTIGTLWYNYLPNRPPSMISNAELEALEFLKGQPDGIVLTQTFDKDSANAAINNPPRPLYLYESTAYVSALSGKVSYLEDQVNLNITGYKWEDRASEINAFFKDQSFGDKNEFLAKKGIKYVYTVRELQKEYQHLSLGSNKIFENSEVLIYKFD